jgi:amino acid transporter
VVNKIRFGLLGPPLPTQRLADEKLNKLRALATFSPDALSSIAYANQEIFLALVLAGSAGLALSFPVGLAIAALLIVVALSYLQTIQGYPSGGGSYVVARENLGTLPGMLAAAALLVDYILTAAVSLTAGVEAVASAFPDLWAHRVLVSLALLAMITLFNMRGLRETGTLMAIPVYLFLFTYLPMLAFGLLRLREADAGSLASVAITASQPLTTLVVLRAFASGSTALTGIEAISNGVPVFRPPEAKNAGRTLIAMALLMGVLFLGSITLTQGLAIVAGSEETILSALARRLLGSGPAYLLVQLSSMLILAVAANTSFAGFPRLAALLAGDGFLPHQLQNLGDRLVFANGILLLAIASGVLIVGFGGDTHSLVPLFAVGAFLAFTLSQTGMVVHWRGERGEGWRIKAALNALGALATGTALIVVGAGKFVQGAWITLIVIPVLVLVFSQIRIHYRRVAEQLSLSGLGPSATNSQHPRVVVPISGVHRGTLEAVAYAQSISGDVTAIFIELEPGGAEGIRAKWEQWCPSVPLVVLASPYRSTVGPLLDFLDEIDRQCDDGQLATVVLPEFVPAKWWQGLLHNQTAWLIKTALLHRRRQLGYQRAIIDVPYHLQR